MKKITFSFLLAAFSILSAAAQTYNELCERAVAATEQDSLQQAESYIRQALQLEPANPHNALLFPIWALSSADNTGMNWLWSLIGWH